MVRIKLILADGDIIDGYEINPENPTSIEVEEETIEKIIFGNTRYVDGEFIFDDSPGEPIEPPVTIDELAAENAELKQRVEMTESALLDLADMLLTR